LTLYMLDMLNPEKDNNSKKFWKYIKSRKQDTMGIGTLKNNGDVLHWLKWRVSFRWHIVVFSVVNTDVN
jgi:hypothetical protein